MLKRAQTRTQGLAAAVSALALLWMFVASPGASLALQEEHPAPEHSAEPATERGAAAEHGAAAAEHGSEEHGEEHSALHDALHWANFVLLIGALVYLVRKMLVPFLNERGRLIREDMDRSARTLAEASQRLGAVEEKLKGLDAELAALRQAAFRESAAEQERIEQAAAIEAQKIGLAADQEIDAAVKAARQELKRYTSELALGLAEQRIQQSLTPDSERRILGAFVRELGSTGNGEAGAPKK
jgi:F0F1-type ATP synthase membrane subunit b/b'